MRTQARYLMILLAICLAACSRAKSPEQQAASQQPSRQAQRSLSTSYQSEAQAADVKTVARAYGVTEERANEIASRAAEMSDGKASKQDMLDALKAARGEQ